MKTIDLNCDTGEMPEAIADGSQEALMSKVTSVNVACGGHAGDAASMARVVEFCAARGTPAVGAHPSYPDRDGFGRRTIAIDPAALEAAIRSQCAALAEVCAAKSVRVVAVKPHGALYHDANRDRALAEAVVRGAHAALGTVTVIGPPRGALHDAAAAAGLPYAREGFADRSTRPDGSLVPRSEPNALITDPAAAAARAITVAREVDTVCVHGDTPGSLAIAQAVREALRG